MSELHDLMARAAERAHATPTPYVDLDRQKQTRYAEACDAVFSWLRSDEAWSLREVMRAATLDLASLDGGRLYMCSNGIHLHVRGSFRAHGYGACISKAYDNADELQRERGHYGEIVRLAATIGSCTGIGTSTMTGRITSILRAGASR